MDLCSTLNAPRLVYFGDQMYFVRAISLEGMSILLAWLDDVIPGRSERTMPPRFGDPASQEQLASDLGAVMLVYVALKDQGVSYGRAAELAALLDEISNARLVRVLFSRRRTKQASEQGTDIAETWCEKGMAEFAREIGIEALRGLSMDQFEWLAGGGNADVNPAESPESLAKIQAEWEANELPRVKEFLAEQERKQAEQAAKLFADLGAVNGD